MEKYIDMALKLGANCAKVINPKTGVVTAPWTLFKCQFGCPNYGKNYCCPPFCFDYKQTREMLDCYSKAILFGTHDMDKIGEIIATLNRELFHDGYFKVIYFGSGKCRMCSNCNEEGKCPNPEISMPSMEGCGIDVYTTVTQNGFFLKTLKERGEEYNCYGIILVE